MMSEHQPHGYPSSSSPTSMTCPHCGASALPGSSFCPLCGKRFPAVPPPAALHCTFCGARTAPGGYCASCGKPISGTGQPANRPAPARKFLTVPTFALAILLSLLANVWLATSNSSLLSRYLSAHDDVLYLNRYLVFVPDGDIREYHSYDCKVWAQMGNYTRYYMTVEDAENLDYAPCPLCR